MFQKIIHFSVDRKFIIILFVLSIIIGGIYSLRQLPIDAVPDITNNQVQVVTSSPTLAPQEVEQLITFPIEFSVANIPRVVEIRSISRYGLSVVTIVFEDGMEQLDARQFVQEQLNLAAEEIPEGLGNPELMPITTGLGEIYQYTIDVEPGYENQYDPMQLRTIQDWIVKRQMSGIPGIIEISSFGGFLKQYEVSIDPLMLRSFDLTLAHVYDALTKNNQNSGGSYIEKSTNAYYIRSEGRVKDIADIENIVVDINGQSPILIKDFAKVQFGSPKRYGAMSMDGNGEAVGGIALMLKGANSSEAIKNVQDRIERIQSTLPEGIRISPYLDRSDLVTRAIDTVKKNLIEGGVIVILVLLLLLGNWRAGLIVASVIPLSMLFAFIMMNLFGVSANLMSLGAIDFGIVVDGAVIIVENALHVLVLGYVGKKLTQKEMDDIIKSSSSQIYQSAAFGVLIILVVFLPVITLTGIEGKMFQPMALTVSFALLGAMILSLTYVPMVSSWVLQKNIKEKLTLSDRLVNGIKNVYKPTLQTALKWPKTILTGVIVLFFGAVVVVSNLGAEFIPTLEEGDLAMQMAIPPGSSLQQSVKTANRAEKVLRDNFPEVEHVVSKIGTSEVPTDPMAIEDADIMIILKDKSEWESATDREELADLMKEKLNVIAGASFEFTQPIQLRFNELMTGAKTDIAIKVFGENVEQLARIADDIAQSVENIPGAADIKVEQTEGLTQWVIEMNRARMAQYGISAEDINQVIRSAFAGEVAGVVFENEQKFDLVVRYDLKSRENLNLNELYLTTSNGNLLPLNEVATLQYKEGPMQITRENAQRRITIGVNIRNRDVASLVEAIEERINSEIELPAGYYVTYGGQFENLEAAKSRLSYAVPAALFLIIVLLYFAFSSAKYALLIFSAVPMSAIGGIAALWLRGMPFSISAGIGFIALFGVAVLNGIVLISYFNQRLKEGKTGVDYVVIQGSLDRLRPVLMTAAVAAFGFLPMALSTSAGAEVQKPLATVVIGGLISSTLLTLFVLPNLYVMFNRKVFTKLATIVVLLVASVSLQAQEQTLGMTEALELAKQNNAKFQNLELYVQQSLEREKGTFNLGMTSFSYMNGEINEPDQDWQWQIDQNFGNLFYLFASKQAAEAQTDYQQSVNNLTVSLLKNEVEKVWVDWYLAQSQIEQLESRIPEIESLAEQLSLSSALGELNIQERLSIQTVIVKLNEVILNAQLIQTTAKAQLERWTGQRISRKPSMFNFLEWVNDVPDSLNGSIQLSQMAKMELLEKEIKATKSQYAPEFSLGYFQQEILDTKGLNGIKAGINMPLFSKSAKQEVKALSIERQVVANNQKQELRDYSIQMIEFKTLKSHLLNALKSVPNNTELSANWNSLNELLKSGEINLFEWARLVDNQLAMYELHYHISSQINQYQSQLNFLTENQ